MIHPTRSLSRGWWILPVFVWMVSSHEETWLSQSNHSSEETYEISEMHCTLSRTIIFLEFNATTGHFQVISEEDDNDEEDQDEDEDDVVHIPTLPPIHLVPSVPRNQEPNVTEQRNSTRFLHQTIDGRSVPVEHGTRIGVKACWCAHKVDRPIEFCQWDFDSCIIYSSGPVACVKTSGADTMVSSSWPVAIFWVVALAYACIVSEPGGSARDYIRRKLCLSCTGFDSETALLQEDVRHLIRRQPERAAYLFRTGVVRQLRPSRPRWAFPRRLSDSGTQTDHDAVEAENDRPTEVLELRTKTFHMRARSSITVRTSGFTVSQTPPPPRSNLTDSSAASWLPSQFWRERVTIEEMDDELEQGIRCAICLNRLEEGTTVGDIVCGHMFHKECIKDWLRRKNSCPLCQEPGIARVRSAEHESVPSIS